MVRWLHLIGSGPVFSRLQKTRLAPPLHLPVGGEENIVKGADEYAGLPKLVRIVGIFGLPALHLSFFFKKGGWAETKKTRERGKILEEVDS